MYVAMSSSIERGLPISIATLLYCYIVRLLKNEESYRSFRRSGGISEDCYSSHPHRDPFAIDGSILV